MKYCLLLLLAMAVFTSCSKDYAYIHPDANKLSLQNSDVVSTGNIVFSFPNSAGGLAKIYLRKDGTYVLGLEGMYYIPTSSTSVYFSDEAVITPVSIKLFSAATFCNNIYFTLPSAINIAAFKHLVLQTDGASAPAATAVLN